MIDPVVDYLVARHGMPAPSGGAYDYVLAGDGLFLCASNVDLDVRIPVASCAVRGLPPLYPACTLKQGRVPQSIWDELLHYLHMAHIARCEMMVGVRYEIAEYRLIVPPQAVGPASVSYPPQDDLVLELHSHGAALAHFSRTDTADEQRLRIYGVVGRLDSDRPQVSLRAGAYGYFLRLPWTSVFDGAPDLLDDTLCEPSIECA